VVYEPELSLTVILYVPGTKLLNVSDAEPEVITKGYIGADAPVGPPVIE